MNFIKKEIPEIILIKPNLKIDDRGYFIETFIERDLKSILNYDLKFCQDNETKSKKGVLRGLHFQLPPFAQSKLVRVIEGEVLDIAVDIRLGSPTYGHHIAECLNSHNKHQLFIPRGFAHGFVVLSEWAIFSYKVDNYYSPEHEIGLAFDDPALKIDWILPHNELLLSEKDKNHLKLDQIKNEVLKFNYKKNLYE